MSDDVRLLISSDPHRFWELVRMDDPDARFAAFTLFDDLALCEIIRYGLYNGQGMIGPLALMYRALVMQLPEARRFALFLHLTELVEAEDSISVNAFLPFMLLDDSLRIVAMAVIDYVTLGPLSHNDPMSRVKDIVDMIACGSPQNEGAAFGALLHIGDPRVCQLLRPLRDSLDDEALQEAVKCQTGFVHAATAEFYLDWLEGLEGHIHDRRFGLVASGLGLLRIKRLSDDILTGERPFPKRGATLDQWLQKPMKHADYLDRIAPRLYAIERAEPPPRVMPLVLAKWGLPPRTDPSETARLDDSGETPAASF